MTLSNQDKVLRPIIVQGLGVNGQLISDSTKRDGIVDLTDIAPTVQWIQSGTTSTNLANPLRLRPDSNAVTSAANTTATTKFYDDRQPGFILSFVVIQVVLYIYAYARKDHETGPRWSLLCALTVTAVPLAAWLTQLACSDFLYRYGIPSSTAWSSCFRPTFVHHRRYVETCSKRNDGLSSRILLATIAVIAVSALTNSTLQLGGFFGSSPALGARYYGLGNVASALLLYATVLWAALVIRSASERGADARNAAWWRTLAVAAIITAIVGSPGLGPMWVASLQT